MSTYVATGRGGAGNLITSDDARKQQAEEASQEAALATSELSPPPQSEYKHLGRGGAGNWYVPSALSESGAVETPADRQGETPEPPPTHPQSLRPWSGRGGVGNYAYAEAETQAQVEAEERERAAEVEERVKREVEEGLARPGEAWVRQRKNEGEK